MIKTGLRAGFVTCLSIGMWAVVAVPTSAQTTNFDGGGDGTNWTDPLNWDTGEPVNVTFDAVIDGLALSPFDVLLTADRIIGNLTVGDEDILRLSNTTDLEVGTQINNVGTIRIIAGGSTTSLRVETAMTLTGGGTVIMEGANARIADATGGANTGHLINDNNTILGRGIIGNNRTQLTNHGTIQASVDGGSLTIDPGTGNMVNDGVLEAIQLSTLRLNAGAYDNTGGIIRADTGSSVEFSGGPSITNGTLATVGTGVIETGNATLTTLTDVTLDGLLRLNNGDDIELVGTLTNNASSIIRIASSGSSTDLRIEGAVTLTGGGTVEMIGANARIVDALGLANTGHLTNSDHLIHGRGNIGNNRTQITNHGTIRADVAASALIIDPGTGGLLNDSLMEATNQGILSLSAGTYINTGGTIRAGIDSVVELSGGPTITNGTLSSIGTGIIETANATKATLTDVTLDGLLRINNADNIELTGTFTDNATSVIRIDAGGSSSDLLIEGPVTLTGGGTVEMNGVNARILDEVGTLDGHLTNNDHLIHGNGQIGVNRTQITNHGTIRADVAGLTLTIDPDSRGMVNDNLMEATNGADLILNLGTYTNTLGTIRTQTGSTVSFSGGPTITNGTLSSIGTGLFETDNATITTLNDVTLGGLIRINNADNLEITGTFTDNPASIIRIAASGSATDLLIEGPVTLTGGGTVEMNGANARILDEVGTLDGHLTNNDHLIHGNGQIGVNRTQITNHGIIRADVAAATMIIDPNAAGLVNDNLMEATNGANLILNPGTYTNTGGTIRAQTGSTVTFSGGPTINNGTLSSIGTGLIETGNATNTILSGVTLDGMLRINNTDNLELLGTVTNNPASLILVDGSGSATDLRIEGNATLTGGGTVELGNVNSRILDETGAILGHLTNADNLIHGNGQIGVNRTQITNAGTIAADDAATTLTIDVDPRGLTNTGTLRAENTATLRIVDAFANDGRITAAVDSTVRIDGTLTNNAGGFLTGNGEIQMGLNGNVDIQNDGTIAPGASPGKLVIDAGTITFGATGSLEVELGGLTAGTDYDRVDVFGDVVIDGTLDASIFGGYVPVIGDTFDVLVADGSVSGSFSSVNLPAGPGAGFGVFVGSNFVRVTVGLIQGDLNFDGFVGIDDLNIVLGNWNQNVTPGDESMGDPSGDGFVGIDDLNDVLGNWNGGTPFPATPTPPVVSASVPEPATFGLMVLSLTIAARRRRYA